MTDLGSKPVVDVPAGAPPTELQTRDLVTGEGDLARGGDTVTVQYVGVSHSTGREFDSSWGRGGQPAVFPLSAVIPGFAQGIEGMRVGGRREIVIPPDLGYGPAGTGPIGPNETLIFVVDLVGVAS